MRRIYISQLAEEPIADRIDGAERRQSRTGCHLYSPQFFLSRVEVNCFRGGAKERALPQSVDFEVDGLGCSDSVRAYG
jgi:hypothetical protein